MRRTTPNDALQFTTAEPASAPSAGVVVLHRVSTADCRCLLCAGRQGALPKYYAQVAAPTGTKAGRFAKASLFGIAAGLAGAAIWFAIRRHRQSRDRAGRHLGGLHGWQSRASRLGAHRGTRLPGAGGADHLLLHLGKLHARHIRGRYGRPAIRMAQRQSRRRRPLTGDR